METAMPRPLPNATSSFKAGEMASDQVKYPHLPRAIPVKVGHTTYPSLASSGKAPSTKKPFGMTLPILTKQGGHAPDDGFRFTPIGDR